ncbi:hypothetical protein C8R46DRAFT_1171476 [Mycena filopes]|nr:hypothetical protein C8R46DRAFT_1171476 [Mycena filopes]
MEEDLTGAHQWSDDEAEHLDPSNKRMGKAREVYPDQDDASSSSSSEQQEYPPVTDEEAETRRIEENLRRWEVAERMKRKAARDSVPSDGHPPTVLSNVWRASSIWKKNPNPHNINPNEIDVVPLEDIAATPTPSPTHSESSNPFANPAAPNPFSDAEAVMSPSTDPPPVTPQSENADAIALQPQRPALLTASSSIRRPPTPKPLGLPPPRAPPPPLQQTTPPPVPVPTEEVEQKTRWWHEWLCGFGEGPDRGGDHQAGRTNPFE